MKTLKMLLVAFAITMSNAAYAGPDLKFVDEKSLACEVEYFLEQHEGVNESEIEVVLFFSVSEDQKIQSLAVASPYETVNSSIFEMLENSELSGGYWQMGRIYEIKITRKPQVVLSSTGKNGIECAVKG